MKKVVKGEKDVKKGKKEKKKGKRGKQMETRNKKMEKDGKRGKKKGKKKKREKKKSEKCSPPVPEKKRKSAIHFSHFLSARPSTCSKFRPEKKARSTLHNFCKLGLSPVPGSDPPKKKVQKSAIHSPQFLSAGTSTCSRLRPLPPGQGKCENGVPDIVDLGVRKNARVRECVECVECVNLVNSEECKDSRVARITRNARNAKMECQMLWTWVGRTPTRDEPLISMHVMSTFRVPQPRASIENPSAPPASVGTNSGKSSTRGGVRVGKSQSVYQQTARVERESQRQHW